MVLWGGFIGQLGSQGTSRTCSPYSFLGTWADGGAELSTWVAFGGVIFVHLFHQYLVIPWILRFC